MKKSVLFSLFFILCMKIIANPIFPPMISISELYFNESDEWVIELEYLDINLLVFPIDSIIIISSSGIAKLPEIGYQGEDGVFVFNNDSLDNDFIINRFGDSLTIKTFISSVPDYLESNLIFGNFTGAKIGYPRQGQSLWKYKYAEFYLKNNQPSIGTSNEKDKDGMYGILEGTVFDKFSNPLTQKELIVHDQYDTRFNTAENGYYQTKVFAKESVIDRVVYQLGERKYQTIPINSIQFTMEPDSVVYRDIYLHDALQTGIDEINLRESPVKIYPNPANRQGWLNYEASLPVRSSDCRLELYSTEGRLLISEKVTEPSGKINLPDVKGPLLARFSVNQKIVYSNKILVQ